MTRPIAIQGEKIAFAPIIADDIPLLEEWMADLEVTSNFGYLGDSLSPGSKADWFQKVQASGNKHFSILRNSRCIGRVSIFGINQRHQHAEFGIVIGDKTQWGRGYGTEATRLMCDYGLTYLGLHNLFLWVYAYNRRAIAAYHKAGFWEAGRMKEWIWLGEEWHDAVLMQCNRESIGRWIVPLYGDRSAIV